MSEYRLIVRRPGGPEVMEREDIALPQPGPGEVRLRQGAIGLNFIDTYHRSGLYPLPLPTGIGSEAAGTVEAIGPEVTDIAVGDRVAYAGGSPGAYATVRLIPASRLVRLPRGISDEVAAAVMLKGLTAWMLAEPCAKLQPGQSALVHSAAGGVGSLLVQWLKAIGVTVIAHASSAEKAALAAKLGADHALHLPLPELAGAVRELTGGHGVDAVFDGVGAASWEASLASTAKRGLIASYGNSSGPVPPIRPLDLSQAGSLFLTRPAVSHYVERTEELRQAADRLFGLVEGGKLIVDIGQRFPLENAAEAHHALESRQTTGSTLLIP